MKEKILLIILLFISSALVSIAAERNIMWEPVAGASGYFLEIKDSEGNIIVSTTIADNLYSVSKLKPGAYSFQVATLNILKQQGESTRWIEFVIEKLYIPELKSVSRKELLSSFYNKNIVINGNNLKLGAKLFLRGNGREIALTDFRIISDTEATFSCKPDSSSNGKYDLVIVNRGDAVAIMKDAINIVEKEAAKTICFAGIGYSVNIPLGKWSDYYESSYTGVSAFSQLSGRNIGWTNIVFETELDAARFNYIDSLKKSTLSYATVGIGLGYYFPIVSNSLELFFKLQGGGVYTSVTLDESLIDKKVSSFDMYAMPGVGARIWMNDIFFIDSALGLKTIFYLKESMYDVKVSLSLGWKF